MKKTSLFLSCFFLFGFVVAQTITVREKNGIVSTLSISSIQKLTFATGNLNVNKTDGTFQPFVLSDIRSLVFNSATGLNLPKGNDNLILFPNPVINKLFIKSSTSFESRAVQVEIIALNGMVIYKTILNLKPGLPAMIDVSTLQNGMYLCRIYTEKTNTTTKFIKKQEE